MLSKVGLDERARRDDAESFAARGVESSLDQSLADAAPAESWRHLRMHEHHRVTSPLVVEDSELPVDRELEPRRCRVVGDAVIHDRVLSGDRVSGTCRARALRTPGARSEEHTSE